jgi:hypothetical protein
MRDWQISPRRHNELRHMLHNILRHSPAQHILRHSPAQHVSRGCNLRGMPELRAACVPVLIYAVFFYNFRRSFLQLSPVVFTTFAGRFYNFRRSFLVIKFD